MSVKMSDISRSKWGSKQLKLIVVSLIATFLTTSMCFYMSICYNDSARLIINSNLNDKPWGKLLSLSNSGDSNTGIRREYNYNDSQQFISEVFQLMTDYRPRDITGKVHDSACTLETLRIDPDYEGPVYSKEYLSKCMIVNYDVYEDLKLKHEQFLNDLPLKFPDGLYEGRGIIMVGGGRYSLLGFLVIKILRERGTTLPIEVFIPPGARDELYCNDILPKYNAKCITLNKFFDDATIEKFLFRGYQFKSLLFLVSSFNEMLYIDSDNYPLYDVDPIFDQEPFTSHGLILWPDFWRRATAPLYYDIAGLKIGKQIRFGVDTLTNVASLESLGLDLDTEVSLHDREGTIPDGTSESSSIFMNKRTHLKTMMLSMYYNLYGPQNYYALLSQDTFGEGDKETFAAAAVLVGDPFWQVKTRAQPGGALLHIGKRPRSTTMIQYNPSVDYSIYKELYKMLHDLKQTSYNKMRVPEYYNSHNTNISFVHYNLGKLDPLTMSGWNRRYGYDLTDIGFDFELRNVEIMVEMFCSENDRVPLEYVGFEVENVNRLCLESQALFERMNSTSEKVIIDKLDLDKLEPFSNI